jgi:hypothetical protein
VYLVLSYHTHNTASHLSVQIGCVFCLHTKPKLPEAASRLLNAAAKMHLRELTKKICLRRRVEGGLTNNNGKMPLPACKLARASSTRASSVCFYSVVCFLLLVFIHGPHSSQHVLASNPVADAKSKSMCTICHDYGLLELGSVSRENSLVALVPT